jgi:hypothetical protein
MAGLFRKQEREKEKDGAKEKAEGKEPAKTRERGKDKDRGKTSNASSVDASQTLSVDDSPSDSRQSRDTYSVHTQTSVSESRESLTLDSTFSNTPSEPTASSATGSTANLKEPESVVKKLFRKSSSSRFSLSSRLGKDSGLFKKGPGSTTNSDKNMSAERSSIGDFDDMGDDGIGLGRSYDSVTSSPSLGPAKAKDKEGRMSGWRFSMKKKGKDPKDPKDSLDLDRDKATESETGPE